MPKESKKAASPGVKPGASGADAKRNRVEEYSHSVFNAQHRRMLRAFPHLKSTDGEDSDSLLQMMKDLLTAHRK